MLPSETKIEVARLPFSPRSNATSNLNTRARLELTRWGGRPLHRGKCAMMRLWIAYLGQRPIERTRTLPKQLLRFRYWIGASAYRRTGSNVSGSQFRAKTCLTLNGHNDTNPCAPDPQGRRPGIVSPVRCRDRVPNEPAARREAWLPCRAAIPSAPKRP